MSGWNTVWLPSSGRNWWRTCYHLMPCESIWVMRVMDGASSSRPTLADTKRCWKC